MRLHEKFIARCNQIANNGLSLAMPNPSVGAVIVYQNQIIGEGFTSQYGKNHAEVNAINAVRDKKLLQKATLYVSLEPCCHFGKTPPCTDLIISHKIPNVVIGAVDTNQLVAGKGIKKLIEAGINVTVGVLEKDCLLANQRFFTFHNLKRPYIILKWAASQNGFIAPNNNNLSEKKREPIWLSNSVSRQLVHKWRSEEQAILVGTNTIIADNPSLTTRDWNGKNPIRIILDQHSRIPKNSNVLDNQAETYILSKNEINFDQNMVSQICDFLYHKKIQSVIIEGGAKTLQTFIDANIWDEARVFKTPVFIQNGIKEPVLNKIVTSKTKILTDDLLIYHNHD